VVRTLAARRFSQRRSCAAAVGKSSERKEAVGFEKSGAKLLLNWTRGRDIARAQINGVFCYFLFTKSSLFFLNLFGQGGA
jgi:hypothetical protein